MRASIAATILASALLPADVLADEISAITPSGAAETMFSDTPRSALSSLANSCMSAGWSVTGTTDYDLTCEVPLSMGQSVIGQALLGNSYSTPPRRFFRFNAAQTNNLVRVQASGWIELQMAFGQTRRTNLDGPEFQNSVIQFMQGAGGQLPIGTRFPNHAFLGVKFGRGVPHGKGFALPIDELGVDSPAGRAGVLPGDLLIRIADKRLTDVGSLYDGLAKAARTPTFKIEVLRGDNTHVFEVTRSYRQPVSELEFPVPPIADVKEEPPAPIVSVADELTKLAKLKSDGFLTDAEFQAQKERLLGK